MHACTCNARSHALYEVYALYPRRIAPIKKSDVCYIRQPEFSKRLTLTTTLLLPLKLFHGCDCISIHPYLHIPCIKIWFGLLTCVAIPPFCLSVLSFTGQILFTDYVQKHSFPLWRPKGMNNQFYVQSKIIASSSQVATPWILTTTVNLNVRSSTSFCWLWYGSSMSDSFCLGSSKSGRIGMLCRQHGGTPKAKSTKYMSHCTACGHRIAHRKWKDTKLQPGIAGPGNRLGCCFISFHFLRAILCPQAVGFTMILPKQQQITNVFSDLRSPYYSWVRSC